MAGPNDTTPTEIEWWETPAEPQATNATAPLETPAPAPPPSSAVTEVSGERPAAELPWWEDPEEGPAPVQEGVSSKEDYFDTPSNDIPAYIDAAALGGQVPHLVVEKAQTGLFGLGEGPSGKYSGKLAIDKGQMRDDLVDAQLKAWQAAYVADNGTEPSEKELSDARTDTTVDVNIKLGRWEAERRGRGHDDLWVDMDRAGAQANIHRYAESGPIGRLVAPLSASWHGVDVAYSDGAPQAVSYNEGDLMGNLDWAGRISIGTYLATAYVASGVAAERKEMGTGEMLARGVVPIVDAGAVGRIMGAWGSPEHLELLGSGHDMFSLADEIGLNNIVARTPIPAMLEAVGIAERETTEAIGGQLLALGAAFFDPDIFMVASIPKAIRKTVVNAADILGYSQKAKAAAIASHVDGTIELAAKGQKAHNDAKATAELSRAGDVAGVSTEALAHASGKANNKAVNEVVEHLRGMENGGEGLAHSVVRLAQSMIGSRTPIGKKTFQVTEAASRAKRALIEITGEVEEAVDVAVGAVNVAAKTKGRKGKKAMGAASAGLDYRSKQLEHMSISMTLQDLMTHRRAIASLGQHLKRAAVELSSTEGQKVAAEVQQGVEALAEARDVMLRATTPETVSAYMRATEAFQDARAGALDLLGSATTGPIDEYIEAFSAMESTARTAMDDAYKAGRRVAGKKTFDSARKVHETQLRKMRGASANLRSDDEVFAALRQALDYTAKGYRAVERGDLTDEMVVVAKAAQDVIDGGAHIWGSKPLETLGAITQNITNPARAKWQVSSERVQEILTAMSAIPARIEKELITSTHGLEGEAQVQAMIHYVSGTFADAPTLLNNLDGRSMWDRARVILRAQGLKKSAKKDPPAAFKALARSFIGSGLDAAELKSHEGKLYKALREVIQRPDVTFEDVVEHMSKVTFQTGSGMRSASRARSVSYAAQAAGMASVIEMTGAKIAKEVGQVSPQMARKMENIMTPGAMGPDYIEALRVFDRMGVATHLTETVADVNKKVQAGVVALTSDVDGYAALIPRRFMDSMDDKLGALVKSTDLYKAKSEDRVLATAMSAMGRWGRLYQASLVTGLFLPRPRHFTNIFIGNFSQIWADDNMWAALKSSGSQLAITPMTMASYIPGVKRWIDQRTAQMAAKMGTDNLLPSMYNVVNNPAVAFFYDPRLVKDSQIIKTAAGSVTFGELRKAAVEEGVLSTFIGSTGLKDVLSRSKPVQAAEGWVQRAGRLASDNWTRPGHYYAEMAEVVEERQRVAYFMELVANRGFSPEEAARKVKDALYDWNSPMSKYEEQTIGKWLMFWGFQRRALGQAGRLLTEPLVHSDASMLDAMTATNTAISWARGKEANSWAKLKDMSRAQRAAKEAMRGEAEGDEDLKRVYPWWASRASSKTFMWNTELSEEEKDSWGRTEREAWEQTGRRAGYKAHTLPAFTPLEMVSFWTSGMEAVAAGFKEGGFSGAGYEAAKGTAAFAAEGGGQFTGPMLEGLYDHYFSEETQFKQKGARAVKYTDQLLLPYLGAQTWPDAEKGREGAVRVNPGTYAAYKLALPLSYELANWTEPALEAYNVYGDDPAKALLHMGQQYSGIFQPYVHDPEYQLEKDEAALGRKVSAEKTEWKKRSGK